MGCLKKPGVTVQERSFCEPAHSHQEGMHMYSIDNDHLLTIYFLNIYSLVGQPDPLPNNSYGGTVHRCWSRGLTHKHHHFIDYIDCVMHFIATVASQN